MSEDQSPYIADPAADPAYAIAADLLDRIRDITQDRAVEHGGVQREFAEGIVLLQWFLRAKYAVDVPLEPQDYGLIMNLWKMVRITVGDADRQDHYLDAANYMALAHGVRQAPKQAAATAPFHKRPKMPAPPPLKEVAAAWSREQEFRPEPAPEDKKWSHNYQNAGSVTGRNQDGICLDCGAAKIQAHKPGCPAIPAVRSASSALNDVNGPVAEHFSFPDRSSIQSG